MSKYLLLEQLKCPGCTLWEGGGERRGGGEGGGGGEGEGRGERSEIRIRHLLDLPLLALNSWCKTVWAPKSGHVMLE